MALSLANAAACVSLVISVRSGAHALTVNSKSPSLTRGLSSARTDNANDGIRKAIRKNRRDMLFTPGIRELPLPLRDRGGKTVLADTHRRRRRGAPVGHRHSCGR